MTIIDELTSGEELSPIDEKESYYYKSGRSEGAPYLFYNFEEYEDLMGHGIIFYPTGVLLYMKDINKDYETSKSFQFHNNDKKLVLKAHNRVSRINPTTKRCEYLPPVKDIEVKVFKDYLYVKETYFEDKKTIEYLVDVLTGEKLSDLDYGEQISFNL